MISASLKRALPFVLVLLALGAAALLLLGRLRPPGEGSVDVRFVREMIQHHVQAVDMAERVHDRSLDEQVQSLALDIMLSQQEQIGQMHGWLTQWGRPWGGEGMDAGHMQGMGMATQAQVQTLSSLPPQVADVQFLQLMTRHHQGALLMVDPVLRQRARPEVQALARQIQAAQDAEVTLMTRMLQERGAQPLPFAADGHTDHIH